MMDIMKYLPLVQNILQGLGALVIFGTVLVRIFPGNKKLGDDVGIASDYWSKIVAFLPTLGMNPQTQKLQDALSDQKGK